MSPTSKQGYVYLGDDDDEEIKVIPIKKRTEDCCDKEQLKTIKTQKVKSCSILLIPWFAETRVWSGETHSETAERQQKIAYQMCFSEMWTDGYKIRVSQ